MASLYKWIMISVLLGAIGLSCVPEDDNTGLEEFVSVQNVMGHIDALDRIAEDNNGIRAAGSSGYKASLDYVKHVLDDDFIVREQEFEFTRFSELSAPQLLRVEPVVKKYEHRRDFSTAVYSGSADMEASEIVAVDIMIPPGPNPNDADSGCNEETYYDKQTSRVDGRIALIQRGSCSHRRKAELAEAAGAAAVIIFNEGQEGRQGLVTSTLGDNSEINIPVLDATFAVGRELYELLESGPVFLRLKVEALTASSTTKNLLAETPSGRKDRIIMVGAHLDSWYSGPGANDNGSGAAAILEIARQLAARGFTPRNAVRFAFWGGEELGLLGSTHYVDQLKLQDKNNIALYLNFDMLGSPNYGRFVYDDSPGASDNETARPGLPARVFFEFFDKNNLPAEPVSFMDRSDHAPFDRAGIPTGGLFAGAEGLKTTEQLALFGGSSDEPYDSCYHKACDNGTNINRAAIDELTRAAAYAVDYFSNSDSAPDDLQAEAQRLQRETLRKGPESDHRGPLVYR